MLLKQSKNKSMFPLECTVILYNLKHFQNTNKSSFSLKKKESQVIGMKINPDFYPLDYNLSR